MATLVSSSCPIAVVAQTRGKSIDDLLPIVKGFKYGYIKRSGQLVVRPRFDHAGEFQQCLGAL